MELIQPNWHVALVHFPIGLLVMGLMAEVVGGLAGATSLRSAGRWMLLLGAMCGLVTGVSGIYALQDLVRESAGNANGSWREIVTQSKLTDAQWIALVRHLSLQAVAVSVALGVCAVYLASSDGVRKALYWPLLAMMFAAVGATGLGAHIGGQAVYVQGLGVKGDVNRAVGVLPGQGTLPEKWDDRAAMLLPPLQLHGLLAGGTLALGVVAFACGVRNASTVAATSKPVSTNKDPAIFPGTGRASEPRNPPKAPLLPAATLMLLTTLLGLTAATAGWWHLGRESETYEPKALWENVLTFPARDVLKAEYREDLRRPAHVALGTLLISVPLLMAPWVKWRTKGGLVVVLAAFLWIGAAAAQVGVGTLLMYDNPVGPLTGFTVLEKPAPEK